MNEQKRFLTIKNHQSIVSLFTHYRHTPESYSKNKKIIFSSETQITGQQNKGRNKKRGRMFADFSTSGCEIQQWIKNVQKKTERLQTTTL